MRTKITGLAIMPAALCSVLFCFLIWFSSIRTAKLVANEITSFMAERTTRTCIHDYNTAMVAYSTVMEALDANLQTARLLLAKEGGVHLGGRQSWQAASDETQAVTPINVPSLAIGSWTAAPGTAPGVLREISNTTQRAVILYERINAAGDMMRVAQTTPQGAASTNIGNYLPSQLVSGETNPILKPVLLGTVYHGESYELGDRYTVACDPLKDASRNVMGMLCVGVDSSALNPLKEALRANRVGAHGSVVIFNGHGRDRGKIIVEPTGIAQTTENQWLPIILQKSGEAKDNQGDGTTIHDAATGADVVVRYIYVEKWDWVIVMVADSHDLEKASEGVGTEFHTLLWEILIAAILALLLALGFGLHMSQRLISPMADLTIRLTSNATQIASSAQQQAANVANLNTSGNQIASAVNEISATSKELLRAMEQLAEDAERTSEFANQGSRGLKGLGTSMESLSTATHSITDKLTTIRMKASKINAVVTAITKVADQTNLLSLNAAIEAEKAGEAGAGFAVVAREIRRLADQSAIATMEIEQMVEAMQEAVSSGVAETRELTEAMERGIQASESISGQFGEIIQRVESMAPRYEAVHEGMQNQSEGAQQISEAMWQLTETGRQTSESVNDLNGVSQQLHEAVRILKERILHLRTVE